MPRTDLHDAFDPVPLDDTTRVFILTGAGISAESGIRTFRDSNGLWEDHRVEDVASPEGWARDPELVWRFYSQRRAQARTAEPNAAHKALGHVGAWLGDRLFLCTQNVDDLHERGGSLNVIHMHGELAKSRCERCERPAFDDPTVYARLDEVGRCECGGRHRPHIVWFGEVPLFMDDILYAVGTCDVFVTIGSSGVVYPAAGFVRAMSFRRSKGESVRSIYVGPDAPDNAAGFDECRVGTAVQAVPGLFRRA